MSDQEAKPKRKRVANRGRSAAEAADAESLEDARADLTPRVKPTNPRARAKPSQSASQPRVKVWVSHDFHTFYPRQPRAIVFAVSESDARLFLDKMLVTRGLKTSLEMPYTLSEVDREKLVYFFP